MPSADEALLDVTLDDVARVATDRREAAAFAGTLAVALSAEGAEPPAAGPSGAQEGADAAAAAAAAGSGEAGEAAGLEGLVEEEGSVEGLVSLEAENARLRAELASQVALACMKELLAGGCCWRADRCMLHCSACSASYRGLMPVLKMYVHVCIG